MTVYISNRDGNGKTSEEGHYRLQTKILRGNTLGTTDLRVYPNATGLSIFVAPGDFKIDTSTGYSYTGWISANEVVNITTADTANPRTSSIVLYLDKNATTSPAPPNNPGIAKVISVDGTPAAVPSAPSQQAILSATNNATAYLILGNVTVPANATSITGGMLTDTRTPIGITDTVLQASNIKAIVGPLMYPVGSMYFNASVSTDPATQLGFGTWQAMGGYVPVGYLNGDPDFGTIGATPGAKTHWHWQTVGADSANTYAENGGAGSGRTRVITVSRARSSSVDTSTNGSREDGTYDASSIQPSVVVYIWKRTA